MPVTIGEGLSFCGQPLQPQEIEWLRSLTFIRTSFCKNLHAKCYMNEETCIVTSLNLYEFSQINNNEMGILIHRGEDGQLYKDTYDEAQRIIRISEEIRVTLERVSSETKAPMPAPAAAPAPVASAPSRDDDRGADSAPHAEGKLSSSKIAQKLGLKTGEFIDRATQQGYLVFDNGQYFMSPRGEKVGVEFVAKSRFGPYFLWPHDFYLL